MAAIEPVFQVAQGGRAGHNACIVAEDEPIWRLRQQEKSS